MFKYFQQRRLKQLFGQYVPDELIDNADDEDYLGLKEQDIYFILIKIDNIVQNGTTPTLSKIIDLAMEHNALVEQIMGPIVLLSYGLLKNELDTEKKDKLISKIMSSNNDNVAIVHGKQRAYAGNTGNNYRCSYGTVLNNISTLLIELGSLNYGKSKEIQQA